MAKSKRQIEAAKKKLAKAKGGPAVAKCADSNEKLKLANKIALDDSKLETDTYRNATGILASRPTARDVKIEAFSLSSYGEVLITDTKIEFTIGKRYGLLGANGSGKSTMLKCLAAREIPIPDHIDIWFLDEEAHPSTVTALQTVINTATDEMRRLEALADEVMESQGPESDLLVEIYGKLESFEPNTFESRSAHLLTGLGFTPRMMQKETKDLSGGWRMRVALAQALFVRPTLLLLDEPTNHLDLEACVWLEQYLATYPYCLLVISHSQDFLNGVCTNIIELTHKRTLEGYTGNYDQFLKTKGENETNQMKRYKKEQDDIVKLKHFISTCGTYSNLVKQAKSKQKILDKMEADGLTEKVQDPSAFDFRFAPCEKLPPPVLAFADVAFSYSGLKADHLYEKVSFGVDCDSRVALVGPNGAGKSTLLKLMVNDISPTEGDVKRHLHLVFGRYHQHSTEALDMKKSVLDFMIGNYPHKKMEEEDWRKAIGRYGITGVRQKTMIGKLSDGLKTRIVFAMLAVEKPNLLLLDEPTNHLDMECIDSLAAAINDFNGGVVLVSHDFRLIDQVAKEVWVCDNKDVARWKGDIRSYKTSLISHMKKQKML